MITCIECGEAFGFRGPPGGHSWDEPRLALEWALNWIEENEAWELIGGSKR